MLLQTALKSRWVSSQEHLITLQHRASNHQTLLHEPTPIAPTEGFMPTLCRQCEFKILPTLPGALFTLPRVRIFQAEGAQLLQELPLPNIIELSFSPRGTYLSTWERHVKLDDGAQHKNLRIFSASTGEELIAFTQKSQDGWQVQYTISESHAIRLVSAEVQVFRPSEWSKGIVDKLKVEGATSVALSPGLNPSIAVFVAEKKVRIYVPPSYPFPLVSPSSTGCSR